MGWQFSTWTPRERCVYGYGGSDISRAICRVSLGRVVYRAGPAVTIAFANKFEPAVRATLRNWTGVQA